jgi:DNA polymerase III subunit beta
MRITAWKNNLQECVGIAERATAKTTSLPVLQNILFHAEKDFVEISATDLQIGLKCRFSAKVEEEGTVVFPGKFVSAPLHIFKEEQIAVRLEGKQLLLSSGSHQVKVNTLDSEEFPIIPTVDNNEPFIEVEIHTWCKGLSQVVGMTGQSQTRPEISGVLIVFERKNVRLVATDSFRLAEKTIPFEKENTIEQSFILPQRTAREIIGILQERSGKVKIYISSTQVVFEYKGEEQSSPLYIKIVSRLIEGEYPRYEDVIPSSRKTSITVSQTEFLNHIKAAGIFAGKTNEVRVAADPTKNEVSFFSQNNDIGEHTSTLQADITGESGGAAFNWRFLSDGLLQMQGDSVEFILNGEDGAALLRASEQEGYRYVIMPIKA